LQGTFKGNLVQAPCNEQGHLQLDQVAQRAGHEDINSCKDLNYQGCC